MKAKILVFSISILFLVSGCTSIHEKLLYNKKYAFYSYIFGDIKSNHISAEHKADVYTTIGSCQKTISALLAYKTLGADYRYATNLYITKKNNKIHDIVVVFAGDPTLKTEDLIRLLQPLNNTTITGKIFLDASLFKTPIHSPNLMLVDIGTEDGPPISSITIDKNLIIVTATPGKLGKPAALKNDRGYFIDSKVITTLEPTLIKSSVQNNRIEASGKINPKDHSLEFKLSPINFDHYILYKIKSILKTTNIKGNAVITRNQAQLPKKLILLNTVKSETLNSIIPPALKKSDNLVFDSLYLKIINSQNTTEVRDWNDGDAIIKDLIKKYFNIDMQGANFVDGSGVSRYDRVQPRKLFALLQQGYSMSEFVTALPSPREPNSSLAKRTDLLPYIKAKTGTMASIKCLCGYSITNHPQAFVIVASGFAPPAQEMHPILDNFVNRHVGK